MPNIDPRITPDSYYLFSKGEGSRARLPLGTIGRRISMRRLESRLAARNRTSRKHITNWRRSTIPTKPRATRLTRKSSKLSPPPMMSWRMRAKGSTMINWERQLITHSKLMVAGEEIPARAPHLTTNGRPSDKRAQKTVGRTLRSRSEVTFMGSREPEMTFIRSTAGTRTASSAPRITIRAHGMTSGTSLLTSTRGPNITVMRISTRPRGRMSMKIIRKEVIVLHLNNNNRITNVFPIPETSIRSSRRASTRVRNRISNRVKVRTLTNISNRKQRMMSFTGNITKLITPRRKRNMSSSRRAKKAPRTMIQIPSSTNSESAGLTKSLKRSPTISTNPGRTVTSIRTTVALHSQTCSTAARSGWLGFAGLTPLQSGISANIVMRCSTAPRVMISCLKMRNSSLMGRPVNQWLERSWAQRKLGKSYLWARYSHAWALSRLVTKRLTQWSRDLL